MTFKEKSTHFLERFWWVQAESDGWMEWQEPKISMAMRMVGTVSKDADSGLDPPRRYRGKIIKF